MKDSTLKLIITACLTTCFVTAALSIERSMAVASERSKWQKKMIDCGCAEYDSTTGEFYTIDTAAAPEAAPILEPQPGATVEESKRNYKKYLKENGYER